MRMLLSSLESAGDHLRPKLIDTETTHKLTALEVQNVFQKLDQALRKSMSTILQERSDLKSRAKEINDSRVTYF